MNVTIKDLARVSGVGISTVSRVLNGSGPVSQDKRERVMQAVRELNYVPNTNARNLRKSESNTVLILTKSIINPFFQKIINNMEKILRMRGLSLEIRNVGYYEEEMVIARRESISGNLCGIIIMGGVFGYTNEDFEAIGVPCVLVTIKASERVNPELYSSVIIDDAKEMERVTEQLIREGHRRIGCIYTQHNEEHTPNTLRAMGYRNALVNNGINVDPKLVASPFSRYPSGYEFAFQTMMWMMEKNPDMTAVVCMSDILAIGAAKAVLVSGKRIPEDISIVGFDGTDEAEYFHPALDTVVQPAEQFARHAADALSRMMAGEKSTHTVLRCQLMKRGSCRSIL